MEWDIVCRVGVSFENSLPPSTFGGGCEVKEFDLVKLDFYVEDTIGLQLVQWERAATRWMEGFNSLVATEKHEAKLILAEA